MRLYLPLCNTSNESRLRYEFFQFAASLSQLVSFPANEARARSSLQFLGEEMKPSFCRFLPPDSALLVTTLPLKRTCAPTERTRNFLWKPSNNLQVFYFLLSEAAASPPTPPPPTFKKNKKNVRLNGNLTGIMFGMKTKKKEKRQTELGCSVEVCVENFSG